MGPTQPTFSPLPAQSTTPHAHEPPNQPVNLGLVGRLDPAPSSIGPLVLRGAVHKKRPNVSERSAVDEVELNHDCASNHWPPASQQPCHARTPRRRSIEPDWGGPGLLGHRSVRMVSPNAPSTCPHIPPWHPASSDHSSTTASSLILILAWHRTYTHMYSGPPNRSIDRPIGHGWEGGQRQG